MEMLKGLGFAHKATDRYGNSLGIIHRDVSPSNIMISYSGDVKIGDFGVAKAQTTRKNTDAGTLKGKVGYMSPEQIKGKGLDCRSDVFAAGIILYETLTMSRLFVGGNDLDVMLKIRDGDLSQEIDACHRLLPSLREILKKALNRNIEGRYQSCDALYGDLRDILFRYDIKTSAKDLEKFMNLVFKAEISEEKSLRLEDPAQVTLEPDRALNPLGFSPTQVREAPLPSVDDFLSSAPWTGLQELKQKGSKGGRSSENPGPSGKQSMPSPEATFEMGASSSGRLEKQGFARLLFRAYNRRLTGMIRCITNQGVKQVFVRRGSLLAVTSNILDERIGAYLVRHKHITPADLKCGLDVVARLGGHLGDALVGERILSTHDLIKHLQGQLKERTLDLFSWEEGEWAWYPEHEPDVPITPLGIEMAELFLLGLRHHTPTAISRRHFNHLGEKPLERVHGRIDLEDLRLSQDEMAIVSMIDQGITLNELQNKVNSSDTRLEKDLVWKTLYLLTVFSVFRIETGEEEDCLPQ